MSNNRDEDIYEKVIKELNEYGPQTGLWALSFSEAEGDENKAKALYIKYRAAQLKPVEVQKRIVTCKTWVLAILLILVILTLTFYALNLHDEQEKVKDAELQQKRMLEQEEFERQLWSDAKASAIKIYPFSKNIRIDLVDRYTNEKTRHFLVIPQIELSIYKTDSNELINAIDKNKTVLQSLIVKDLKKLSYEELYGVNKDELIIGVIRARLFNEIPESSGNLGWSNFPRRGLSTITLPRSFIIQ